MNLISAPVQDRLPQPFVTPVRSSVSGGYGGQQEDINIRFNAMPKTLLR
jgi:hypothetical protein